MPSTDVKSKTPDNKATFLLLIVIIICFIFRGAAACFGHIEKVKIFQDRSIKGTGYVSVAPKGKQVLVTEEGEVFLYKVATDPKPSFLLYDPTAKKFVCWNHNLDRVIGMDFKTINRSKHWQHCKFIDGPSEKPSYQELLWASNTTFKMKFNQKGRYFTPKVLKQCKKRAAIAAKSGKHQRHNRCKEYSDFLVLPADHHPNGQCLQEAYNAFCQGELRSMPEVQKICRETKKKLGKKRHKNHKFNAIF